LTHVQTPSAALCATRGSCFGAAVAGMNDNASSRIAQPASATGAFLIAITSDQDSL
jgi:hypothetical protein